MDKIFIILWTGRDVDTGFWDSYPCYTEGFFLSEDEARRWAKKLNNESYFDYDEEAEETPYFSYKQINRNDKLKERG